MNVIIHSVGNGLSEFPTELGNESHTRTREPLESPILSETIDGSIGAAHEGLFKIAGVSEPAPLLKRPEFFLGVTSMN